MPPKASNIQRANAIVTSYQGRNSHSIQIM
jgi:hypothetical protein